MKMGRVWANPNSTYLKIYPTWSKFYFGKYEPGLLNCMPRSKPTPSRTAPY